MISLASRLGTLLGAGFFLLTSCAKADDVAGIPKESAWIEYGVVLRAGLAGTWDERLAGASTPAALVRKEDTYFLYYGGADGARSGDGGPRHRAIGVATSRDGIHFTKYADNPILTYLPTGGEEEGANSAAVALDVGGRFVMLYGAATQVDPENIIADARLAFSADGLHFADSGLVLDHRDTTVYGYGDEIFPLAAYRHRDRRHVFYVTGGGATSRDLAVASGPTWSRLHDSSLVVDGSNRSPARMAANVNWLGTDRIVLFVQRGWHPKIRVEVRTADPQTPHRLSDPIEVYDGPLWREDTKFFTVFLDVERRAWFLYRLNWQREVILHLAPYLETDRSPPSPPRRLRTALATDGLELCWEAGEDADTGVVAHLVYRDGVKIASTLESCFLDADRREGDGAEYRVSAVNLHGTEGRATSTTLPVMRDSSEQSNEPPSND